MVIHILCLGGCSKWKRDKVW